MHAGAEQSIPVSNVTIVLRHLGSRERLASTTTDEAGRFEFGEHIDGWYQLETCRDGLNAIVVPVRVDRASIEKSIDLTLPMAN